MTATDITKLKPMSYDVLTTLPCSRTTSTTDHEVDTRSGWARCCSCGAPQILDSTDLLTLLEDA